MQIIYKKNVQKNIFPKKKTIPSKIFNLFVSSNIDFQKKITIQLRIEFQMKLINVHIMHYLEEI